MKIKEWIKFFKQHNNKKIFSFSDLLQLTTYNRQTLYVELNRLTKQGIINRITREWYENPFNPPTKEEIAMILRYPCYLSMEYALSKHGILSQTVYTLTLVTTKTPYTYKTRNTTYEYHQIKKEFFWGYNKKDDILIAEPEKALIDLIHIRYRSKNREEKLFSLTRDLYIEELNHEKLYKYAKKINKRIGKLVEMITHSPLSKT
ncbi:MAG: hypothetical protein DRN12_06440 [Thermoplasmata archaeon]|nr:MAG: hypothetical protein DRN12_06440 [Thermoplasmata archaeon]